MEYLQYLYLLKRRIILNEVLNLVINGIPSIQKDSRELKEYLKDYVLNLVINGIPSILWTW